MGPRRTCVGCRHTAPAAELVRLARSPDGELIIDQRAPGRGVWLCAVPGPCLDLAARRKAFERALRTSLAPGAVDRLRAIAPKRGRIEGRDVILNATGNQDENDETERGPS